MANRVTYTDEYGSEHELNPPRRSGIFVVIMLLLSFIMGLSGGIFGLVAVSGSEQIKSALGLSNLEQITLPSTSKQKITLEESSAVIDTVKKVSPAVVSITSVSNVQDFFGQVLTQEGAGTGFIITSDGLIVTNKHVVEDEKAEYTVITSDGKDYKAKVMAQDAFNDLAVLKIEAKSLPVVTLGDSDALQVGQFVIAIGNALGQFQNTVTLGVVSAKDRKIEASNQGQSGTETLEGLIQTDAAINSGNSGGPLVNLVGQVIGINTAVAAKGVAEGIGFAIPINTAKSAIDSVKKTGKIIRPRLGVSYVMVTKDIAQQAQLTVDYGAYVYAGGGIGDVAVASGSPADKAGIVERDIITYINSQKLDEDHTLGQVIKNFQPGDEIEITFLHKGEEKKAKVVLDEM